MAAVSPRFAPRPRKTPAVTIFLHLEPGDPSALPAEGGDADQNSRALPCELDRLYEGTPQKLLSQSRFHPDLNTLFLELFNADVYAHLRRAMGLVSACTKEISRSGHIVASVHIGAAIATMRRYNRIRTQYFQDLLKQARNQTMNPQPARDIVRRPGNPYPVRRRRRTVGR